jgi:hypothetical protein
MSSKETLIPMSPSLAVTEGASYSNRQPWCEMKSDFIVVIPSPEKLVLDRPPGLDLVKDNCSPM